MRKIRIVEHITLDGVIQHSDETGDFPYSDWTVPYRTPAGRDALLAAYGTQFDVMLGRRTYDMWSEFWPKAPAGPWTDALNSATKYVATHRPESLAWGPAEALGPDFLADARRLQAADGPDIVVCGSSTLTSLLLEQRVTDEVLIVVYPLWLGTGKRLFASGAPPCSFELIKSTALPSGVIFSNYKVVGDMKRS